MLKKTRDYKKFKSIRGNRPHKVNNTLKQSIEKYGMLSPVIVNRSMQVVDGQHRLDVAKKLKIPVEYIIKDIPEQSIIEMNSTQKKWRLVDYVNYFCSKNKISYKRLRVLCKSYDLSINSVLAILKGGVLIGIGTKNLKEGRLSITEEDVRIFKRRMKSLSPIFKSNRREFESKLKKSRMLPMLVKLIEHEKYDHLSFINNLNESLPYDIKSVGTYSDGWVVLKSVYNRGLKPSERIK